SSIESPGPPAEALCQLARGGWACPRPLTRALPPQGLGLPLNKVLNRDPQVSITPVRLCQANHRQPPHRKLRQEEIELSLYAYHPMTHKTDGQHDFEQTPRVTSSNVPSAKVVLQTLAQDGDQAHASAPLQANK